MTKILLRKFVSAWSKTENARWECAEIARLVLAQDGNAGIEELAQAVHVSAYVVREMANVAQRIEPTVRKQFKDMPWGHFVAVRHAKEHFATGSPEANPAWWLAQARQNEWTRNALRSAYRRLRRQSGSAPQKPDRTTFMLAMSQAGENEYLRLLAAVEPYNEQYGPYYGTLELVFHPVEEQDTFGWVS